MDLFLVILDDLPSLLFLYYSQIDANLLWLVLQLSMVALYISKFVVDYLLLGQMIRWSLIRNSQIRDNLVHQVYIPCSKYRFNRISSEIDSSTCREIRSDFRIGRWRTKERNGQIILSNMLSIPNEILSKCFAVKIADFKVDIRG